jgi:hypothetical protein
MAFFENLFMKRKQIRFVKENGIETKKIMEVFPIRADKSDIHVQKQRGRAIG